MKLLFTLTLVLGCVMASLACAQAMTSTNYTITWDSLNAGGNELGTSTNYTIYDSIGQPVSGASTSTNYSQTAGYRAADSDLLLSFVAYGQDVAASTTYTTFDASAPEYVVVGSASGIAVGDYIAVVENEGYSALVAIGRVIGIAGTILTVDAWEGDHALMSFTPSGGNDYVYRLDASTIPLGSITAGSERVAVAGGSVFSSATSGHTVYIQADGNLRTVGGAEIPPVTDGTVSSNAEEYGAESIGTYAVSPGQDLGVTTTQRAILSSSVSAVSAADRFLLLFKLGVTSSTTEGAYSQAVYLTLTSNF